MHSLFSQILELSRIGSMTIIVVLCVRYLLKNAPKKYSYLLWSVVWLRLTVSRTVSWNWSLYTLLCRIKGSQSTVMERASITASEASDSAAYILRPAVANGTASEMNTDLMTGVQTSSEIIRSEHVSEVAVAEPIGANTGRALSIDIEKLLLIVWCIVFIILVSYSVLSAVRLWRKLRFSTPDGEGNRLSGDISSPFVFGLIRPTIYLPYGLTGQTKDLCVMHEKAHIRRGDHLAKGIAFFIVCIHWFNPLVWIAFKLMERDQEESCDETVLNTGDALTSAYCRALLAFASNDRRMMPEHVGFSDTDVKKRIKHSIAYRKRSRIASAVALAFCVLTIVSCGTDAAKLFVLEQPDRYETRNMMEDPSGYGSDEGYLQVSDGLNGKYLTYIDYESGSSRYLCSVDGCSHDGSTCESYLGHGDRSTVVPVLMKDHVLLFYSSRTAQSGSVVISPLTEASRIEIKTNEGVPDGNPIIFASDVSFPMNNARIAVSDDSAVFVLSRIVEREEGNRRIFELGELNINSRRYSTVYMMNSSADQLRFLGVTDRGFIVDEIKGMTHKIKEIEFCTLVERSIVSFADGEMTVEPYGNCLLCLHFIDGGKVSVVSVNTSTLESTVIVDDISSAGLKSTLSDLESGKDIFISGFFSHYVLLGYLSGDISTAYSTLTRLSQVGVDIETGDVIPIDLHTDVNGLKVPVTVLGEAGEDRLIVSILEEDQTARYKERKALITIKDLLSGNLKLININTA